MVEKRFSACLFAICMIVTLTGSCMSTSAPENEVSIWDTQREEELLSAYAEEISYVEEKYDCEITQINAEVLEMLKTEAVLNLLNEDYSFGPLMDELSCIFTEQEILAQYESSWITRINDVVVGNSASETIHEYGPLRGKYLQMVTASTGTAVEVSGTIEVNANEVIHDMIDISGSFSLSASSSFTGPAIGDTLYNGRLATHAFACEIMYGSVTRLSYDLCDRRTGEVKSHHEFTHIASNTAHAYIYASYVQVAGNGQLYVDSPISRSTSHWSHMNEFETQIKSNPYQYLSGNKNAVCPYC